MKKIPLSPKAVEKMIPFSRESGTAAGLSHILFNPKNDSEVRYCIGRIKLRLRSNGLPNLT